MIKKIILANLVVGLAILPATNAMAQRSSLTVAGDITQIAVPVTALGIALYKGDKEGQKEFAKSFIVNTALVYGMKYAFKDTDWGKRPNGSKYSFPSGHSAAAFSGAFFLQTRYGWEYGAPAIALAGFTGYTRVKGKYHYWRDVIGGAAIAFGANYFFVDKYKDSVNVSTSIGGNSALVGVSAKL
jgi:membrane-associated phospholipid phosphatase